MMPEPQNAGAVSSDDLAERVAQLEAELKDRQADRQRISDLEDALAAAQSAREVPAGVPAHAGGPGTDIQPTWSQYEQEIARAGEHPLQKEQAS
jgi:hypothetical protein